MKAITSKRAWLLLLLSVVLLGGLSACSSSSKSGTESEIAGSGLSESDLNLKREGRFADGSIPLAEGEGLFRDIPFAFDSYKIEDYARQDVEYNVDILKQTGRLRVQLEGHCDERGTAEYNLALGQRRARAVLDMLSSYGITSDRLNTISYGSEIPLDPRHTEEAWAKNRRVHFSAFTAGEKN